MAVVGNLAFSLGTLIPLGNRALNDNNPVNQNSKGALGFMIDQSGLKMYRYIQNRISAATAMAVGSLASCVGTGTGGAFTNVGSPVGTSTTNLTCSTLTTANIHVGSLMYVEVTTSNVAPQGESSPVVTQTTTSVTVDPKYPFSASLPASGMTVQLIGTYNAHASAAGDLAYAVRGVVVGSDGIDAANYGWAQSWGYTPQAILSAAGILTGSLIAGTANLTPITGGVISPRAILGFTPNIVTTASVITGPVVMTLDFGIFPGHVTTTGVFSF